MKKKYYLTLLFVLIVIIFVIVYLEYIMVPENFDSTTKEGCEKLGGKWGIIGIWDTDECNLPKTDFGNVCYDRGDCQGECIAVLTSEEIKTVVDTPIIKNGKCSEYRVVPGCNYFVNNGKVIGLVCVD